MSDVLTAIAAPWASLYAHSAAVRTLLLFGHVGGLVASAGYAIVRDRAVLSAAQLNAHDRSIVLDRMMGVHRTVITGLIVVIVSGTLLFAADVQANIGSVIFWVKMAAVAGLAVNGVVMLRASEDALRGNEHVWPKLCESARMSYTLWIVTTLLGAALPNL